MMVLAIERDLNIAIQEDETSLLYLCMEELRIQYRNGEHGRVGNSVEKSQNNVGMRTKHI